MGFSLFTTIRSDDEALMSVQDSVRDSINQLVKVPILDGVLLEDLVVSTTITPFPHRLNRAYRGFFITKSNADVRIWDASTSLTDRTKFIDLDASGSATISIWIF